MLHDTRISEWAAVTWTKSAPKEGKHKTEITLNYSSYSVHSYRLECFLKDKDIPPSTKLPNRLTPYYTLVSHKAPYRKTKTNTMKFTNVLLAVAAFSLSVLSAPTPTSEFTP